MGPARVEGAGQGLLISAPNFTVCLLLTNTSKFTYIL